MISSHAAVRKNTFIGLLSIAIWSFTALFAVQLTAIPPFQLLFCEFLIAFFIVLTRYAASPKKRVFLNFRKADFIIASTTLVVNQLCYFLAFRYAPAAQADLIHYLWPTMIILLSTFLPKERLSPSYVVACLICLFGVYILLSSDGGRSLSMNHSLGYLFALGAAVSWSLYCLYSRYRGESNSANCISWACGPAAIVCFFIHLYLEKFVVPSFFEGIFILFLGVFQVGLAFYFWERGLKRGCIKFLSLSSYAIPVFSVMLLVAFGKADFNSKMISAAVMISASPLFPFFADRFKESAIGNIFKFEL